MVFYSYHLLKENKSLIIKLRIHNASQATVYEPVS